MVIQSNVLRVILGQDIPFVYPNYEWTFNNPPTFKIYCHKYWQWKCDILPSRVNLRRVCQLGLCYWTSSLPFYDSFSLNITILTLLSYEYNATQFLQITNKIPTSFYELWIEHQWTWFEQILGLIKVSWGLQMTNWIAQQTLRSCKYTIRIVNLWWIVATSLKNVQ
jgi:hypothetical protein